MKIANPIYDVVFKYLLEDKKVAMLFLSAILEKEIIELEFKPQEYSTNIEDKNLTIYRLDFKAKVKLKNGEIQLLLIELQKAKLLTDIVRFRRYLGKQYINENNTEKNEKKEKIGIPIVTIYFIGYTLEELKGYPVIYVKREYIDKSNNEVIDKKSNFIESLTHDSIIIQIREIKKQKHKTRLEKLLSIFEVKKVHTISINEEDYPEEYKPIIQRLVRAISEEEVVDIMDMEDEILEELELKDREILEMKDKYLKEKEERKKAEEKAKNRAIEIARNLLDVLDEETISIKTGLSIEEIKELKN